MSSFDIRICIFTFFTTKISLAPYGFSILEGLYPRTIYEALVAFCVIDSAQRALLSIYRLGVFLN